MKPSKSRKNPCDSSAVQKHNSHDLVDLICPLHDSILGLILSFLPTKNAVATSVLSKRWKFVWMSVHNLDFCCLEELAEDEYVKFVRFVNRVLLLHDAGLLNKFCLVWEPMCISSHVSSWINTAITRNAHELIVCALIPGRSFCIDIRSFNNLERFEIPITVFSCNSLQSLELDGYIFVSTTLAVCLPRLKSLKLVCIQFLSEEVFEKLLSGCPMLTYMHLHVHDELKEDEYDSETDEVFMYKISSTSLRRLELYFSHTCKSSLKLEASSLEYFKLDGYIYDIFVQKSLISLVEADFKLHLFENQLSQSNICDSIIQAVCAFDCAKALTLSVEAMQALSCGTIRLSTKFKRLVKLVTEFQYCYFSSLQDLIQSSDILQVLKIRQIPCEGQFEFGCHHDHLNWTTHEEVPRCLSSSLKHTLYERFNGLEEACEMISYMLKHGSVLEVMEISCDGEQHGRNLNGSIFEWIQEICEYPRKSPFCEIKLFGWTSNGGKVCCTAGPETRRISKHFL